MYNAQKQYTFIAALLMNFITGGPLFGMEKAKTSSLAVFEELPLELNMPILLKWLERTLGYNYTTRTLSIPGRDPFIKCKSLIPTCNPDLVLIATLSNVLLYNIQTEQIEKKFEAGPIQQIAVNVDKTKVAITQDREIVLWNLSTEEKSVAFKADEFLCSVALSSDGKYILAGGSQDVYLWNISTKNLVKKVKVTTKNTFVSSVAFNRKSNKILTSTRSGETSVWDLQGNELTSCENINSLNCAVFSPDERSIIVAGIEGIIILDVHTGLICLANDNIGGVFSIACSPDGNTLIAGSAEGHKMYVIDLKTAKVLTTLENFGDPSNLEKDIVKVGFTSDGNNIVSASGYGTFCLHRRSKEEDNEWATTRKETALEMYLQLLRKPEQEELSISTAPTTNYYQLLQNIPKDKAFLTFAILAMIFAYNM